MIPVAAVAMLAVAYLFKRTPLGAAMRAVAESSGTATLLGIKPDRVARVAWALGMGLAALGAAMLVPTTGLAIGGFAAVLFRSFAGIFLGGLTSMYGAVIGGVLVGVLDSLAATYVSASLRDTFVFSLVILVLLVRPAGPFRRAEPSRGSEVRATDREPPAHRASGRAWLVYPALAVLVVLLIEGGAISPTRSYDVSLAAVYGIVVLSMSLLAGWGGVWSVGQPALVAIGAYTAVHGTAHGWSLELRAGASPRCSPPARARSSASPARASRCSTSRC